MGGFPDATVVLMVRAGCFPLMIAQRLGLHTGEGEYPLVKGHLFEQFIQIRCLVWTRFIHIVYNHLANRDHPLA